MSWLNCPACGVKRSVEQLALPKGWQNASCWNCKDPGWIQPYDSDDPLSGRNSRSREEVRCDEQTANVLMEQGPPLTAVLSTFQAALGIPMVVSDTVPTGVVQLWQDGKMVKEIAL